MSEETKTQHMRNLNFHVVEYYWAVLDHVEKIEDKKPLRKYQMVSEAHARVYQEIADMHIRCDPDFYCCEVCISNLTGTDYERSMRAASKAFQVIRADCCTRSIIVERQIMNHECQYEKIDFQLAFDGNGNLTGMGYL